MEKDNYHRTVEVKTTPEEAFKKISQVDGWWAKNFTGEANKLNDKFAVHFGDTFVDFRIKELLPNKKVVWEVTDCNLHWINDKKEWNDTEVVFELSQKGKTTLIDFTHIGLIPGAECYNDCVVGWDGHVTKSLVNFINDGNGMPQ